MPIPVAYANDHMSACSGSESLAMYGKFEPHTFHSRSRHLTNATAIYGQRENKQ